MSSYQVRARSGTPIADDFDSDIPPLVEDFDTGRTFSVTEAGVITLIGPMNQAEIGFILYPQTAAEIAAGVTPTNYAITSNDGAGIVLPKRYGATFDGSTDDTNALNNAILVASQTATSAQGGIVQLSEGVMVVSSTITLPNRVSIRGLGARASVIQAKSGFSGTFVLNAVNGTSAMFNSLLMDLSVDANNIASLGCILADAWQEDCGCRRVLLQNFRTFGIKYQNGYGGASYNRVEDVEIFCSSSGATAGIRVEQISAVGAFKLHLIGVVFSGSGGTFLPIGCDVAKDSVIAQGIHAEDVTKIFNIAGVGNHNITTMTGKSGITSLVEVDSAFTGSLIMQSCFRNGTTNYLKDNRTGGYGTITGFDPTITVIDSNVLANVQVGSVWAAGWFDGSVGVPVPGAGYNFASITDNGAGDWTINLTRALPVATALIPMASSNLNDAIVRIDQVGVTSFRIRLRVAGVATDANEVKFTVVRIA